MFIDFSQFKFDANNKIEYPDILLYSQDETVIGVLGDAFNLKCVLNFSDVSEVSFTLPNTSAFFQTIRGLMYVEIAPFGKFVLTNPEKTSDGIKEYKECVAYSREYELNKKQFYISDGTYNLYNPVNLSETLLGLLLECMPGWSIGEVDTTLYNRYRTFDSNTSGVYDFMMNVAQKSYGACFVFDNINRKVYVYDSSKVRTTVPIYLSLDNLINEIKIQENTDDVVTCLNVRGADEVDIRSANPLGTNKIYNLDYYFSQPYVNTTLKANWDAWKVNLTSYEEIYYNISILRNIANANYLSETAKLIELRSELAALNITRSSIIEGIAQGLKTDSDLTAITTQIEAKENEIALQEEVVNGYKVQYDSYMVQLSEINTAVSFNNYFSNAQMLLLDNYIKESSFQDSTFVSTSISSYNVPDTTKIMASGSISLSGGEITVSISSNITLYNITGGSISINGTAFSLSASVVRSTLQYDSSTNKYVLSAFVTNATCQGEEYASGTVTSNGLCANYSSTSAVSVTTSASNLYFTANISEYQTQSVERELYEYSKALLVKMSEPSYNFEIDSLNFIFAKEFESFKNVLALGSTIYLEIEDGYVLNPILLSVELDYENLSSLKLSFGNKYRKSTQQGSLADIISEASYSTASTDFNKYNYANFKNSGAQSQIKAFMNSALDASVNNIKAGMNMGVNMDGTGIHLCKYNDNGVGFQPEQIHMINNMILMTDDDLQTAKLAIGKFYDKNAGTCWGLVGPNILGTLLAGQSLIIESEKEYGGIAQFKVDAQGAQLNNARFIVTKDGTTKTQAVLDPAIGFAMGIYPLFSTNQSTGELTLNTANAKFYLDNTTGNLTLKGIVYASAGEFTGKITATSGTFTGTINATAGLFKGTVQASRYLDANGIDMFNSTANKFNASYLNLKGISVTDANNLSTFSVDANGNVSLKGNITMTGGSISWGAVAHDPAINTAQSTADAANTNINSLVNGNLKVPAATFINGTSIMSPVIIGGSITSNTTINVGTDATIGKNLYMKWSDNSTGKINLGDKAEIQMEKSNSSYNTPVLSVNTASSSFIEISTGEKVLGSYNSKFVNGDIIVRAYNNIRLGTVTGHIYLNDHYFSYDNGILYIDGQAYSSGGGTAKFA